MESELNISQKKLFIYNKINDMTINSNILTHYIISNDLKYTKNNNGIFINLYSINDNYINDMYKIIIDRINYANLINNSDFNIVKETFSIPLQPNSDNYSYKEINDKDFDEYDIDLINFI